MPFSYALVAFALVLSAVEAKGVGDASLRQSTASALPSGVHGRAAKNKGGGKGGSSGKDARSADTDPAASAPAAAVAAPAAAAVVAAAAE